MRGQLAKPRRLPVGRGDDRENAGGGLRFADIDGIDLRVRVRGAQHDAVGHAGKLHIVGVVTGAAHQAWILEPRDALTDCKLTHGNSYLRFAVSIVRRTGAAAYEVMP